MIGAEVVLPVSDFHRPLAGRAKSQRELAGRLVGRDNMKARWLVSGVVLEVVVTSA